MVCNYCDIFYYFARRYILSQLPKNVHLSAACDGIIDGLGSVSPESLNIERRDSCRAMLNFEPVAPPATGGISPINKSALVVHM